MQNCLRETVAPHKPPCWHACHLGSTQPISRRPLCYHKGTAGLGKQQGYGARQCQAWQPNLRHRSSREACLSVRAEISYIMVKPDGVQRGAVGEVISRLERKGFRLAALKLFKPDKTLAEEHYKDLSSKPFFKDLVEYIISGPVVAMVWEGAGVVKSARKLIGATNPLEAEPGTIRGDLAVQTGRNVVHGSDSPENGEREAALWFGEVSLVDWQPALAPWLTE